MFWRKRFQHLRIFRGKISEFRRRSVYKKILREQNLQKKVIRIIYWLWERKFQYFPQKFAAELSERHSRYPKDEFRKKNSKYTVLWFSRTPSKIFRTSCEEFSAGLSIMHFTRPKGVSVEISVWNLRFAFTDFKRYYVPVYCTNIFGRFVQCESKVSRWSYFRKKNLLECLSISLFLGCEQQFFKLLTKNWRAGLPNLPSKDLEEILTGKNVRKKNNFSHHFLILSWWFSGFCSKSSEGPLKLHFVCPEDIFEGKKLSN